MGTASSTRHQADDIWGHNNINTSPPENSASPSYSYCGNQSDIHIAKKPRLSLNTQTQSQSQSRGLFAPSSRLHLYPQAKPQLKRAVHAPCRVSKFGSATDLSRTVRSRQSGAAEGDGDCAMGNVLRRNYERAREGLWEAVWSLKQQKQQVEVCEDSSDDSSVEVVGYVDGWRCEDRSVITDYGLQGGNDLKIAENGIALATSLEVSHLTKVEDSGKVLKSLSPSPTQQYVDAVLLRKKLLDSASRHNPKLHRLQSDIQLQEARWESYKSLRLAKKLEEEVEAVDSALLREPFVPLEKEDEVTVARAFSNINRRKLLVAHESSNIEITGEVLQCLRPCAWLNDEVINVYLELLKERERREPKKFLKCHYFNTFFYKKLIGGRGGYDYKSVKRWTTQRKLGYGLIECEKIFVPIHKEVHWCLAVINKKDKKFQYLDSLGGTDSQVLKVLARYFVDEVKDKSGQDIDVTSWEREFVKELPEQENGYDCGIFMIKYADFYSRGMGLNFDQEHMPYFRLRTAKEILQLRAD